MERSLTPVARWRSRFPGSPRAIEETFNGVSFRRMIQGDHHHQQQRHGPAVRHQPSLLQPGDAARDGSRPRTRSLGSSTAIMAPTVSFGQCARPASRPLHADDIAGVQFIIGAFYRRRPGPADRYVGRCRGRSAHSPMDLGAGGAPPVIVSTSSRAGLDRQHHSGSRPRASRLRCPPGSKVPSASRSRPVTPRGLSQASPLFTFNIGGSAPGQPTVTSAAASGGVLTINWTSGAGRRRPGIDSTSSRGARRSRP